MANKKIKKIKIGTTTYDIDVEGLEERLSKLEEGHSVDGTTLVIGESENATDATTAISQVQVGTGVYDIQDAGAVRINTDKHTVAAKVYGIQNDGAQKLYSVATSTTGYTIPYRLANGQIATSDPIDPSHAATKNYVDEVVSKIEHPTIEIDDLTAL